MGSPRRYRTVVVDHAGNTVAFLPQAELVSVADELNAPGQIDVNVPYTDPGIGAVAKLAELQVWRAGDSAPVKWGVITRVRRGGSSLSVQAPGLWWYFGKRYVGKAGRTNYLTNGGFETGDLTGWTPVGVTAAVVTTHRSAGTYGLQLTQNTPGVDTFVTQQIIPVPGNYYTLDADLHIYSDYTWHGPAFQDRGLHVELVYPGGNVQQVADANIDGSYAVGHSYHLNTGITVPPDAPSGTVLQIRLYAPGGRVMWDEVKLTLMESLSFFQTAQEDIIAALIVHAQDPAFGKTSLNIGVEAYTPTTLRNIVYQHVDHGQIRQLVEQFAGYPGGVDFDVDPSNRQVQLFAHPRGAVRAMDLVLSLRGRQGDSCTGDGFSFDEDAEAGVSTPIVQGDGSGPGREEASVTDTSATGGVDLEEVVAAVPGTNLDGLYGVANQELAKSRAAMGTLTISTKPWPPHLGVVKVGDTLPVVVDYRGCVINEAMRVVRAVEKPNGTLTYTCNPT